jgi:archaellum component FlaC
MAQRPRSVGEADLTRLKRERDEADRRYNDALTALDAVLEKPPELPHPPPPPDDAQLAALNTRWQVLKAAPALPAGVRGRVARFVWGLVEPVLTTQQAFNSAMVDHVNRNLPGQRETEKALASTITVMRQQAEQLARFQARLITYLQQVTPYVDTKDYEISGIGRRITEDAQQEIDRLETTAKGLAAAVSGVSDEMLRRWESLLARDQRYTARIDEIRSSLGVAQQQLTGLKRIVERRITDQAPASGERTDAATVPVASPFADWQYVAFENLFRGSQDDIRKRLQDYVPLFEGASDVLDIGCGRGEFLELLAARGVSARGLDLNHEMVEECRSRGLDATLSDALTYLRAQGDGSPDRDAGRRTPRPAVSAGVPRSCPTRASARIPHRSRNNQCRLLAGVLRELLARRDPYASAPSGYAQIPRDRQRVRRRRSAIPGAGRCRHTTAARASHGASRRRRLERPVADLRRERRSPQSLDVQLDGLCRRRPAPLTARWSASPDSFRWSPCLLPAPLMRT